jgi:hypothetical protein
MCCTIRRTLNNQTRKDTQIKLYRAMTVLPVTHGSEIILKKRERARESRN